MCSVRRARTLASNVKEIAPDTRPRAQRRISERSCPKPSVPLGQPAHSRLLFPLDELADHSDPTEAHHTDPVPDLEMDPVRRENRLRRTPPTPGPGLARRRFPPATGTVRSALIVRDWFHRKGLLVENRSSRHGSSNYKQDNSLRYFLLDHPNNHACFGSRRQVELTAPPQPG